MNANQTVIKTSNGFYSRSLNVLPICGVVYFFPFCLIVWTVCMYSFLICKAYLSRYLEKCYKKRIHIFFIIIHEPHLQHRPMHIKTDVQYHLVFSSSEGVLRTALATRLSVK